MQKVLAWMLMNFLAHILDFALGHNHAIGDKNNLITEHIHFLLHCQNPSQVAALLFEGGQVIEVKLDPEGQGVVVMTRQRAAFAEAIEKIALSGIEIDGVIPTDENVDALYEYLIGSGR